MTWRETTIDRAASWMRFIANAAFILIWVMLSLASVFVCFWLIFRLSQWLYLHLFKNPW